MRFAGRARAAAVLRACSPLVVAAVAVSLLRRFPPDASRFYPRCPVYEVLHLRRPGCGATRALAALLRGQVVEAWHQNALLLLLLPVCVGYGAGLYRRWLSGERLGGAGPSRAVVIAAFAVAGMFMAIRNLWQVGM